MPEIPHPCRISFTFWSERGSNMDRITQLFQTLGQSAPRLTIIKALGSFVRLPVRLFESARPLMILPLVVGLLALSPDGGSAQCMGCGLCLYGEDEVSVCCAGGRDHTGYDECGQGEEASGIRWCEASGEGCEDEIFAMMSETDLPERDLMAIATVMDGGMLAAATAYLFVFDGADKIIRRKCNGAFVARVTESDQRLALTARIHSQGLEESPPRLFGG